MTVKQKRAIYYSMRNRKLEELKKMGLYDDYLKQKPKFRHNLKRYYQENGIILKGGKE